MKPSKKTILDMLAKSMAVYTARKFKYPEDTLVPSKDQFVSYGLNQFFWMVQQIEKKLYLVLSFAGSNEPGDWLKDFDADFTEVPSKDPNKSYKFHHGVDQVGLMAIDYILTLVGNKKKTLPLDGVICTGHSLGGAVAGWTAFKIKVINKELDTTLIAFDCPKWCDYNTAIRVDKTIDYPCEYWLQGSDVHPLPPFGYEHVGMVERVKPIEWWSFIGGSPLKKGIDNLISLTGLKNPTDWMNPHHPERLYKAIQKNVKE